MHGRRCESPWRACGSLVDCREDPRARRVRRCLLARSRQAEQTPSHNPAHATKQRQEARTPRRARSSSRGCVARVRRPYAHLQCARSRAVIEQLEFLYRLCPLDARIGIEAFKHTVREPFDGNLGHKATQTERRHRVLGYQPQAVLVGYRFGGTSGGCPPGPAIGSSEILAWAVVSDPGIFDHDQDARPAGHRPGWRPLAPVDACATRN